MNQHFLVMQWKSGVGGENISLIFEWEQLKMQIIVINAAHINNQSLFWGIQRGPSILETLKSIPHVGWRQSEWEMVCKM